MKRSAPVLAAAIVAAVPLTGAAAGVDPARVRGCMPPGQAHELLVQQKLVSPMRALGEAVRGGQGEAVGVQLCRFGDVVVYDVTLLQHDGRVSHSLVNAHTGAIVVPARASD